MSSVMSKALDGLKDRWEFGRSRISTQTVLLYLTLFLIVGVGFFIRLSPYFKYDYVLNANDPFSQLKAAMYIDENGLFAFWKYIDTTTWYPYGREWGATQYIGTPISSLILYYSMNLIGIAISLEQAAFLIPGILGGLTVLAIYFLGKEIANKKVGLISAFFLSTSPGHIQRSMAGFYDNEAAGVLLILLFIFFFLRALRTGSFFQSGLSGLFLGLLTISWGGASYAVELISLYAVVLILSKKYSKRLFISFSGTIAVSTTIAMLVPRNGPEYLVSLDVLLPLGVIVLMMMIDFYRSNKESINNYISGKRLETFFYSLFVIGTIAFILNLIFPVVPAIQAKFVTVLLPFLRDTTPILASVAEHLIVTWGSLFRNLFLLVFLIPIGVLYCYQKPTEKNIFLLLFLITSLYFAGSMVRLILILAPAACLMGAKAINETLAPYALVFQERLFLSKRKKMVSISIGNEHVGAAFVVMFFLLMFQIFQGINTSSSVVSPSSVLLEFQQTNGQIQRIGDWQEAFDWIDRNTNPTSSVIASWWDYGYWLSVETNRTILVDNATINSTQIGNVGAFLMSTPEYSLKIARYYGITHFVVLLAGGYGYYGYDNDVGKTQWMVRIAERDSNLAPLVGSPIVSDDYFKTNSYGDFTAFNDKFFDSTMWATLSYGVSETAYTNLNKYALIENSDVSQQGFAPEYESVYSQIFKEAYMTSHEWIRIMEIDWDAADRLVGAV